jgi:sec-independent protein translocase protein TatA
MSFFDAPWHIVLVLLAALLLFGSSRLPGAAKALGSSMNIFKKAVKGEGDDDDRKVTASTTTQATAAPPQLTTGTAAPAQQAQIDDLQRQLNELQRQAADRGPAAPTTPAESQPNRQSY